MRRHKTADEPHPRARILDAAIRLFAQNGYEHTSVEMICGEAKVNRAMVSYYYGGKLDLFRSLIENTANKILKELRDEVYNEKDPKERLRAFIEVYVRNNLRHPELIDIANREVGSNLANSGDLFEKYFLQVIAVITDAIQMGAEMGVFDKKVSAIGAATYIFSAINSYFALRRVIKQLNFAPLLEHNEKECITGTLYDLIFRGIRAEPPTP